MEKNYNIVTVDIPKSKLHVHVNTGISSRPKYFLSSENMLERLTKSKPQQLLVISDIHPNIFDTLGYDPIHKCVLSLVTLTTDDRKKLFRIEASYPKLITNTNGFVSNGCPLTLNDNFMDLWVETPANTFTFKVNEKIGICGNCNAEQSLTYNVCNYHAGCQGLIKNIIKDERYTIEDSLMNNLVEKRKEYKNQKSEEEFNLLEKKVSEHFVTNDCLKHIDNFEERIKKSNVLNSAYHSLLAGQHPYTIISAFVKVIENQQQKLQELYESGITQKLFIQKEDFETLAKQLNGDDVKVDDCI